MVRQVRSRLGHERVSERRVCGVLGQPRATQRYHSKRPELDRHLTSEMRRLADARPRFGSERIHQLLPEVGWRVNYKRVHRLWKQEHMQVPRKQRKRRRFPGNSANSCVRHRARHRNHVWSYDFITDRTEDGRQLKILVVIDEFTRESLAVEVGRQFTSREVILTLQYLFAVRGAPQNIRSDNGPEFIAERVKRWLAAACVDTLYIQKASPWENGYVESFNSRLRDELLNRELFLCLDEARYVLDDWCRDYNQYRPHSSIDWQTPASYAASCQDMTVEEYSSAMHADPPAGATPRPPDQHELNSASVLS